jgi:uncharacterized protein
MAESKEIWLIVDGYNVIGADQEQQWEASRLAEARVQLIRELSEYQMISGKKVFIVFDAHQAAGVQTEAKLEQITVFFTARGETADELIERFVREHIAPGRQIYVATSDFLEQRIVFGQGAYRLSSRELLQDMKIAKQKMSKQLTKNNKKTTVFDHLPSEIQQKLEKWRRKK